MEVTEPENWIDLMKPGNFMLKSTFVIDLEFDRWLSSNAAEPPVKFQSNQKTLNPNSTALRLQDLTWKELELQKMSYSLTTVNPGTEFYTWSMWLCDPSWYEVRWGFMSESTWNISIGLSSGSQTSGVCRHITEAFNSWQVWAKCPDILQTNISMHFLEWKLL